MKKRILALFRNFSFRTSPLLCLTAIAGVFIAAVSISCAFPSQEMEDAGITDISGTLDFMNVSRQGFMGGSILYCPRAPSSGQLAKGVSVAVRLGYVNREETGGGQVVFSNIQEKAQYGSLTVTEISEEAIGFTVKLYDVEGRLLKDASAYSVSAGAGVDINGDGLPDLEYRKFAQKREGYTDALELVFVSSQETCTTSMFAVLKEQYARSVYPGGIIGINPSGRFIYSKYEGESAARSVVSGLQRGDYVLDGKEGKYQRVAVNGTGRGARAVSDTEVITVEEEKTEISYLFKEDDFTGEYNAQTFFSMLPAGVQAAAGTGTYIERLNTVLTVQNLITLVTAGKETDFPIEAVTESAALYSSLSFEEVIQLNRMFLEKIYPDTCPLIAVVSTGFNAILPLASVIIDSGVYTAEEEDVGNSRVVSRGEYNAQKSNIDKNFASYKTIFSQPFSIPVDKLEGVLSSGIIKLGIKANFNNTWGSNVGGAIDAAIYITIDAKCKADFSKDIQKKLNEYVSNNSKSRISSFSSCNIIIPKTDLTSPTEVAKNIFNINIPVQTKMGGWHRDFPVVSYGPITLNVRTGLGISWYLQSDIGLMIDAEASFTLMVSGKGDVGMNYGVRWKPILKIWGKTILSVPEPYVSSYFDKSVTNNEASAFNFQLNDSAVTYFVYADGKGYASLSLTPAIYGTVGANISGIVGIDLGVETGLKNQVNATIAAGIRADETINYPDLRVNYTLSQPSSVFVKPWVGLSLPYLGFIGYNKRFDLLNGETTHKNKTLYQEVFTPDKLCAMYKKYVGDSTIEKFIIQRIGKEKADAIKTGKLSSKESNRILKNNFSLPEILMIFGGK